MDLLIREAIESDVQEIIAVQQRIIYESDYFISTSEEFKEDPEEYKSSMRENKQSGGLTLVAEHNGEIAGFLVFRRNQMKRLNHTGSFGMAILDEYRSQGLGTAMLVKMIDWAKAQEGLEKICLGVFSTNERAIAAYKKIGFSEEGREIRQIRFTDGQYADDIRMALFIDR